MKKQSVLVRRALVFTAIVLFSAVAVGLIGCIAVGSALDDHQTRIRLESQIQALSEAALHPEKAQLAGKAALSGDMVWISDADGTRAVTAYTGATPETIQNRLTNALLGYESIEKARIGGQTRMLAAVPVRDSAGDIQASIAISAPVEGGSRALSLAAGFVLGSIAAIVAAIIGKRTLLERAVEPIQSLLSVAVSAANGNLNVRADESAPGELGELGKAINNLSTQLAENMYTLILERNRLKHMIDGLSEGIVAVDSEGHVTHTNPALEKLFTKQKPDPHLPDSRMTVIPDQSIWTDFDGVIASGEPLTRNFTVRDMILKLTITPIIDEIGVTAGAVGLISDITQSERLERTRREYVSNVSHELRTPLTAMRALVEPLKEGMVTSEADRMRYYDIILREVMRLSRLINDQLELSRLQSGTIAIEKKRMALDDLVYDVCDRYGSIAREHGLELNVPTDFSACPPVFANADRMEELLIILLDNAIKYTEKGSVSVSAVWDDELVRLSVRDTGIGIADEDLPYVFDRFYKVDKAHSGKGSGLGLSIAKELLRRMGEDISVSSEKGVGTEFTFTIHVYRKPQE